MTDELDSSLPLSGATAVELTFFVACSATFDGRFLLGASVVAVTVRRILGSIVSRMIQRL